MTENITVTSVAIKDEYLRKMDKIKANHGFPKKYIINQAIKEFFENHDFDNLEI